MRFLSRNDKHRYPIAVSAFAKRATVCTNSFFDAPAFIFEPYFSVLLRYSDFGTSVCSFFFDLYKQKLTDSVTVRSQFAVYSCCGSLRIRMAGGFFSGSLCVYVHRLYTLKIACRNGLKWVRQDQLRQRDIRMPKCSR